jgi:predicted NBD/HSP70 family sugar kinase/biotin operon repressor
VSQRSSVTQGTGESQLPSLDMLRQLTDRHVVEQLLTTSPLTRAEIAARSGISKPTISDSVRRLLEAGVLVESGRQLGKRGPAGTFLTLPADLALTLAVSVGPDGIVVRTLDLQGAEVGRGTRTVPVPATAATLGPLLLEVVQSAVEHATGPVRGCALSVAAPVDYATGRLILLPHAPFLVDELSPRELLADLPLGQIVVDNDVNWAALAELHDGRARDLADFVLCYLGAGIGGAAVVAGELVHGGRGLAGELAHVLTVGPGGRALTLTECFAAWNLCQPGSDALDVPRISELLTSPRAADHRRRDAIAVAVAGALRSVNTLLDPEAILITGPWGLVDGFVEQVADLVAGGPSAGVVGRAGVIGDAPLAGASAQAVLDLRATVAGSL